MSPQLLFRSLIGAYSFLTATSVIVLVSILASFGGNQDNDRNRNNNGQNNNGEREWWWEGPEAEERGQLIFACVWSIIVLVALSIVGYKTFRYPTTFRLGMLGGSLALYANLCLCICFYFINFERREENNGRYLQNNYQYYNNNNNNYREEDEEGRGQKMLSVFGLVTTLLYASLSAFTLWSSSKVAGEEDHGVDDLAESQTSGHVDVLSDGFRHLSAFSVIGVGISFLVGITSLFAEEGERMREEGDVYNFLMIAGWMSLVVVGLGFAGWRVFKRSPIISQLEVGFFTGCLYFFCASAFAMAGLYGGFSLEALADGRRGGPEGPAGSLFFSFVCFTFGLAYLSYAVLLNKYHPSILHANRDSIESDYNRMTGDDGDVAASAVELASGLWKANVSSNNDGSQSLKKSDGAVEA